MKKLRARIIFHKADGLRDARDWAGAAALYQKGLALNANAFPIWVQYGHMKKELGEFDAAESAYLKAQALSPKDPDLHIQLGHLYARMGDAKRSAQSYALAGSLGSDDPHAIHVLPHEGAKVKTSPALAGDASRKAAATHFSHADALRDAGRWVDAAAAYRDGLEKAPNAYPYWIQLGNMLKEAERFDEAEQAYSAAVSIQDTDDDLYLQLGHLKARQGDVVASSRYYARAVMLGSRDRHALSVIAHRPERLEIVRGELARLIPEGRARERLLSENDAYSSFAAMVVDATR